MEYLIRKRKKEDCRVIPHLITLCWNDTYRGIVKKEILESLKLNEQERIDNSYNSFDEHDNNQYVLVVNNNIVGYMNIGDADNKDYQNCGEIFALYILKEYKNKGYGKKLVEYGKQELKKMNFDRMIIGCLDGNPANEFYKHIGGKLIDQRVFEKLQLPENVYIFEI